LSKREQKLERDLARLIGAVHMIYYAAHWTPDREVEEADKLWSNLRDAAGFTPGLSLKQKGIV
jgi:hypothetical protein